MSSSPEFHRIISTRSFLKPALIPAAAFSIVASLLLFLLVFVAGALTWMLAEVSLPNVSGADQGLLPLASRLESHAVGSFAAKLIRFASLLQTRSSAVATLIAIVATLLLLRWVLHSLAASFVDRHVAEAVLKLRQHIHRKAIRLEPADLTGEQTRFADRLFQSATQTLESSAGQWGRLCCTTVADVVAVCVAGLATDWKTSLQTMIPVFLGRMVLRMETQRSESSLRLLSEQVERGLGRISEGLKKTRIVTSFGMESTEHLQFERHLGDYRDRCQSLQKQQRFGRGIRNIIRLAMLLVPLGLLAAHVLQGDHLAVAVVLGSCLVVLYQSLGQIESLREFAAEGGAKADEISLYINRIPSVSQAPGAGFLQPMSKTLTFNQVSFQTAQLPGLIRGLDLRIAFGEKIALLSLQPFSAYALAGMVPRFVDPDLGQVLIDGGDIRKATLESLRAEAIFVGGEDPVFNATVLENITCGQSDITRQQALDAAKLVHADNFIRTLAKGYETILGEHGVTLDPGQMFRLSLARAAVREPAILVIEEPQISLDNETKAMLDDAYQRLFANRTVILLPHRLSTVKKCSRIVLIHEGRIAVDGVHEQLVRSSDLYRHWEYLRFNPFREDAD